MLTWIKRIVIGLLGLVVLTVALLFVWSEIILARTFEAEERTVVMDAAPEILADVERLAQVFGCYRSCHGQHMEGALAWEDSGFARVIGPSLKMAVKKYSFTELEAIIRQGIKPDGSSVWGMPASTFAVMSDEDLVSIVRFIEGYPEHEPEPGLGTTSIGPIARVLMITGEFSIEAESAQSRQPSGSGSRSNPQTMGKYLAQMTCSECHGLNFQGFEGFTPSLAVVKAYDEEAFARLMAEGVGLTDRDLGLMSEVAKMRFSLLRPEEVSAIHAYLQSLN